jgi:drug/metabolite transporter (DMT)-like permease
LPENCLLHNRIFFIQRFIAEREEVAHLLKFDNLFIWALFFLESLAMFLIYSIIPRVLEMSSAAFLNVNLLTSDFYSVLVGIFFKKYQLHYLYFVGLAFILIGTILYSISKPKNDFVSNKIGVSAHAAAGEAKSKEVELDEDVNVYRV